MTNINIYLFKLRYYRIFLIVIKFIRNHVLRSFHVKVYRCATQFFYYLTEENAQDYFHDRVALGSKAKAVAKVNLSRSENATYGTINPYVVFVSLQFRIASMQSREHTCLCRSRITRYRTRVSQVAHSRIENRLCVPRFLTSLSNNPRTRWKSNDPRNEMDGEYSRVASNPRWKISRRDICKEDSKVPLVFSTLKSLTF